MSGTTPQRKTQAQRREESRQMVLDSALKLFGDKGYAATSLEDIAADCGLTIRPIYHYFDNKKGLFTVVNEVMEARILDVIDVGDKDQQGAGALRNFRALLDLCDDPGFRRIVLIDSPVVLGRERWATSPVTAKATSSFKRSGSLEGRASFRAELTARVLTGALAEAALAVAEAEDVAMAKEEAMDLIEGLFSTLPQVASTG